MPAPKNPNQEKKVILFDIDDTLFSSTEFAEKARKNAINSMVGAGLPATRARAFFLLKKIIKQEGSNYPSHFDLLCKTLPPENPAKVIAAGVRAYHDTKRHISPYSKTFSTLKKLKTAGFVLCAATEGLPKKQWDKLIRLNLQNSFDHVFITAKKTPFFYAQIAKKLCISPSNCTMVGDNLQKDILPAKKAGFNTIRILKGKHQNKKARFSLQTASSIGRIPKFFGLRAHILWKPRKTSQMPNIPRKISSPSTKRQTK